MLTYFVLAVASVQLHINATCNKLHSKMCSSKHLLQVTASPRTT